MTKLFALSLTIFAVALPNASSAQADPEATVSSEPAAKVTFGANGFAAMPIGDSGDALDAGVGVIGSLDYPLSAQLELTGRIGYIHWVTDADGFSLSEIPLWGGARYFLGGSADSVYLHGETGFNLFRVSVDTQFGNASDSETELALNLLAGKKFGKLVAEGGLYIGSLDEVDDTLMLGGTVGMTF